MADIPVFAFAAYSGTGKTTIIEKIIHHMKAAGLRVAVIKHDGHDFEIDQEGKDSWRFRHAGADITIISSGKKTAYIENRSLSLQQLLSMVHNVDVILVEGYKNETLPQIGIARAATGKGFAADLNCFIAVMTDMENINTALPCFDLEDIPGITKFILKRIDDSTYFNEEGQAKKI